MGVLDVMKLDIGCGKNKRLGYVGIDKARLPTVDGVYRLNDYPRPSQDDCFEEVFCRSVLDEGPC